MIEKNKKQIVIKEVDKIPLTKEEEVNLNQDIAKLMDLLQVDNVAGASGFLKNMENKYQNIDFAEYKEEVSRRLIVQNISKNEQMISENSLDDLIISTQNDLNKQEIKQVLQTEQRQDIIMENYLKMRRLMDNYYAPLFLLALIIILVLGWFLWPQQTTKLSTLEQDNGSIQTFVGQDPQNIGILVPAVIMEREPFLVKISIYDAKMKIVKAFVGRLRIILDQRPTKIIDFNQVNNGIIIMRDLKIVQAGEHTLKVVSVENPLLTGVINIKVESQSSRLSQEKIGQSQVYDSDSTRVSNMKILRGAVEVFYAQNKHYPDLKEFIKTLLGKDIKSSGSYYYYPLKNNYQEIIGYILATKINDNVRMRNDNGFNSDFWELGDHTKLNFTNLDYPKLGKNKVFNLDFSYNKVLNKPQKRVRR